MKTEIRIAPSILSADFARLGEAVRTVAEGGADWIHVDVMDGCFVPNITVGPVVVAALRPVTTLPLDVHLMIERPERYLEAFVKAGADILTVQAEACTHLHRTLQMIRALGAKAGVALNPHTPLCMIEEVLDELDMVLIMSVNPGFGGQKFIVQTLNKVRELRQLITLNGSHAEIEIDGGVNDVTGAQLAEAGADILVAGSYVFGADDPIKTIEGLKNL